jgi:hypothetical protein
MRGLPIAKSAEDQQQQKTYIGHSGKLVRLRRCKAIGTFERGRIDIGTGHGGRRRRRRVDKLYCRIVMKARYPYLGRLR